MRLQIQLAVVTVAALLVAAGVARGDPCGMVPPIALDPSNPALTRVGVQTTFVFVKDGIEDIVLRPAFKGRVQEFGMLIPFPEPPAIRKVPDDVFIQVANAIDPPTITPYPPRPKGMTRRFRGRDESGGLELKKKDVRVLREEAVGMYQVAVLEAGSADALDRWMSQHGYVYPKGMDVPCEDYVKAGWCFVAVKAKVGAKKGVEPRPGMREADPKTADPFEGAVQAMGFRFRTKQPVVPMRLSAFNGGKLDNRVYVLADEAMRFAELPAAMVERTLSGEELLAHVTDPLPFTPWWEDHGYANEADAAKRLPKEQYEVNEKRHQQMCAQAEKDEWVRQRRDPTPKNGKAKLLFADDLLAAREGRLAHAYEEREKELLAIGEAFGLRGANIDAVHAAVIAEERTAALAGALDGLKGMTMTVIRGDFPKAIIAEKNLHLVAHAETPGKKHGMLPSEEDGEGGGRIGFGAFLAVLGLVALTGLGVRRAAA